MPVLTAQQWKDSETPEFQIDLGGGREVTVRQPDLQLLVLKGMLPSPLLNEVVKLVGEWATSSLASLSENIIEKNANILTFVNTFVCTACVSPRVVQTKDEQAALSGDAMLVDDLTLATRKRIILLIAQHNQDALKAAAAATEVTAAAKDFPEDGPGA